MGGKSKKGGGTSSKLIARLKAEQERSKGSKAETNDNKKRGLLDSDKK